MRTNARRVSVSLRKGAVMLRMHALIPEAHTSVALRREQVTLDSLTISRRVHKSVGVRKARLSRWPVNLIPNTNTNTYVLMKNTTRTLALASLAGVLTTTASAVLPYADGDLILGFRATGGTGSSTNLLVNIGSAATFRDATTQFTLSLGNLDADLDAIFGTTWDSRSDVNWSVSGTQFTAGNGFGNRTLFATREQGFPLGPIGSANSTPWTRATTSTQAGPAGKIQALGLKYGVGTTGAISGTDQIESTNTTLGLIQPNAQTNSFEEYMSNGSQSSSGSSFAYFSGGIEGGFALGAGGTALDLYFMATDFSPFDPGIYEGTFSINSGGDVTFTPTGVPEPSSALMLALSGTVLGFIRRRKLA